MIIIYIFAVIGVVSVVGSIIFCWVGWALTKEPEWAKKQK